MRGGGGGACVAGEGGIMAGGVHGGRGECVAGGMHGIRRDTVNERAVRILLECILVLNVFSLIWQECSRSPQDRHRVFILPQCE